MPRKYLITNAETANEIERKILAVLGVGKVVAVEKLEDLEPTAPVESLTEKITERQAQGA